MLAVPGVSYALITSVLLVYCYAGTIPIVIAVDLFPGRRRTGRASSSCCRKPSFNDRFEDHYLTIFQVAGHVALQLCFLLAAPEIGFAFLSVVFLIFGFGALRMTLAAGDHHLDADDDRPGRRSFCLPSTPIGLPVATATERVAAMLSFVLTIGQCAFVGLYGSTMRKMLYDRSFELKAAYKRIEELAELDELTGASNRRCIMRMLEEEIARAARSGSPCSIALIDLDWFKRINDAYGHPTGDEVLRTFSITMFANIRSVDRFGRYGGEEFLLVLPDMDTEQRRAGARPVARHHCRSRLERILAGHEGDDVGRRCNAQSERNVRHISRARRQRALCSQGAGTQPHCQRLIRHISAPAAKNPPPAFAPGQSHDFESRQVSLSRKSARRAAVHARARNRRSPGRDPAPGNRSLHQRRGGLFGRAGRAVRRCLPVPDRSHRNLGQDAAGQPSRPDRHRPAAHHPRARFR